MKSMIEDKINADQINENQLNLKYKHQVMNIKFSYLLPSSPMLPRHFQTHQYFDYQVLLVFHQWPQEGL